MGRTHPALSTAEAKEELVAKRDTKALCRPPSQLIKILLYPFHAFN